MHAIIIDKHFSNTRVTYHDTVVRHKIAFHNPDTNDSDWMVRQGYLLMIASATEIGNGVRTYGNQELLWVGMLFLILGNTCILTIFKLSVLLLSIAGQMKSIDVPWDVFLPCLIEFNILSGNA